MSSVRLPVIFIGHGNPMNALADNDYTRAWRSLGEALPRPRAVLCVSAHWYGPGTAVTAMASPRTIHDFGGFPRALFEIGYPAPGSPELAVQVQRALAPRHDGVLIVGSGNLVHNLHAYAWGRHVQAPYDWALRFEAQARERMLAGDHRPLIEYEQLGRDAALAAPTPDHYLPLLYVLGAQRPDDEVSFFVEGVDGGSVSMLGVRIGPA